MRADADVDAAGIKVPAYQQRTLPHVVEREDGGAVVRHVRIPVNLNRRYAANPFEQARHERVFVLPYGILPQLLQIAQRHHEGEGARGVLRAGFEP